MGVKTLIEELRVDSLDNHIGSAVLIRVADPHYSYVSHVIGFLYRSEDFILVDEADQMSWLEMRDPDNYVVVGLMDKGQVGRLVSIHKNRIDRILLISQVKEMLDR